MKTHYGVKEVLYTSEQIKQRIAQLAEQITADYANKNPLVVGVLKGSYIFLADLVREMELDVEINFISLSSYGAGTTSSGKVSLLQDLTVDCAGRDVLIVEDIIDSGVTLSHLKELLLQRKANSVEITALLSKASRREVDVDVKYIGFEIPDKFVVGYGMDFAEHYRTLKDVCVLKEEMYK